MPIVQSSCPGSLGSLRKGQRALHYKCFCADLHRRGRSSAQGTHQEVSSLCCIAPCASVAKQSRCGCHAKFVSSALTLAVGCR